MPENSKPEQIVDTNDSQNIMSNMLSWMINNPAASGTIDGDGGFSMKYKPLMDAPAPTNIPQGVINPQMIQAMAGNQLAGQAQVGDMIGKLSQKAYQEQMSANANPIHQFRQALLGQAGANERAQMKDDTDVMRILSNEQQTKDRIAGRESVAEINASDNGKLSQYQREMLNRYNQGLMSKMETKAFEMGLDIAAEPDNDLTMDRIERFRKINPPNAKYGYVWDKTRMNNKARKVDYRGNTKAQVMAKAMSLNMTLSQYEQLLYEENIEKGIQ